MGYRCNARCGFCYYRCDVNRTPAREPSTKVLAKRLKNIRLQGATEIEFTGGEPTIRSDLLEIVALAKDIGFSTISLVSNGLRMANAQYTERLVKTGINDVLLSIHGHTADLHDAHTNIPGSFLRVMSAVSNMRSAGARCRSSSTITGKNAMYVTELMGMLMDLGMVCIHLPVFSPVARATYSIPDMFVRYSDASRAIIRGIQQLEGRLPHLSVKYIPLCFMRGYEKYVMNGYRQSFDPDDWNYYLSLKARWGDKIFSRLTVEIAAIFGAMLLRNRSLALCSGWEGAKTFGLVRLIELFRRSRPAACRSCAYDFICDHLYKGYLRRYGDAEIHPISGPKIKNPALNYAMAGYRKPGAALKAR